MYFEIWINSCFNHIFAKDYNYSFKQNTALIIFNVITF